MSSQDMDGGSISPRDWRNKGQDLSSACYILDTDFMVLGSSSHHSIIALSQRTDRVAVAQHFWVPDS